MEYGFLLKKSISFFLEPLGIVFMLFALGLYFLYARQEGKARLSLSLSLFLLFLFSYPPFADLLLSDLEDQYPKYDYSHKIRYIHVLGHGHTTDVMQPISSRLSDGGTKRVLEGVIIHKNITDSKLIFTGYEGETTISNAVMNSRLAMALGVDVEAMMINGRPVDTKEEAEFTKSIVGEKPFVLVTSAFHMPRAMMLFRSLGMDPIAAPTDFYKTEYLGLLRAPSASDFVRSTLAMHEYVGILWAKLRDWDL